MAAWTFCPFLVAMVPAAKPSAPKISQMLPVSSHPQRTLKKSRLHKNPDPAVDLAENVKGGFEGFFDFLGAGSDDK